MDYTIQGSNAVIPDNPLNIDITISATLNPLIRLADQFTIENIETIVSAENWHNLVCEIYGKTQDGDVATTPVLLIKPVIPEMPGPVSCILSPNLPAFTRFEIRIYNVIGSWQNTEPVTNLNILFYDDNNPTGDDPVAIPFTLNKVESKPVISYFVADKTVLLANDKSLILSWAIDGNDYTYTIMDGTDIINGPAIKSKIVSFRVNKVSKGNHTYTLLITQAGITVKKTVSVRALESSKCNPVDPNIPGSTEDLLVGNICVANDSSALFSLLLKKVNANVAAIECIGYTNEGFSGNWSAINLTDDDINALKPYSLSPMIHLKFNNQALGKLFFIGGSRVEATVCTNTVAVVDLEKDSAKENLVTIQNCSWPSRMGHNCVIFPHVGVDKIWLMGGQGPSGAALNDIWVSDNGTSWVNIDGAGAEIKPNATAPPVPIKWDARCFFGASVQLDNSEGKKALWIGGGFSETAGRETPDIWIWNNLGWNKAKTGPGTDLKVFNSFYLSSALGSVSIDTVNNPTNATGMFVFGGFKDKSDISPYFASIWLQTNYGTKTVQGLSGSLDELDNNNNASIITLYFKGCMWYLVLSDNGDAGIMYSRLYYWVPPVTSYTFKS